MGTCVVGKLTVLAQGSLGRDLLSPLIVSLYTLSLFSVLIPSMWRCESDVLAAISLDSARVPGKSNIFTSGFSVPLLNELQCPGIRRRQDMMRSAWMRDRTYGFLTFLPRFALEYSQAKLRRSQRVHLPFGPSKHLTCMDNEDN